jgi:hypothetical protein
MDKKPDIAPSNQSMRMNCALTEHPEYANYIANIITLWNGTEHALGSVFALLIGTDPWHAGKILGALNNSGAKIDLVESAGNYTLEYSLRLAEFSALLVELRSAIATRNIYAHGVYAIDNEGRLNIIRQGRDWQSQKGRKLIDIPQLKVQWEKSTAAFNHVTRFHNALTQEMPPSPSAAWLYRCSTQTLTRRT